jgi:amino acid transporter
MVQETPNTRDKADPKGGLIGAVFLRATGTLDTLLIISAVSFSFVFTTTELVWFYGNTDGASLGLSLLVSVVPFALLTITYYAISILTPRTSSDYVWVSDVLSPSLGFVWSLLLVFTIFFVAYVGIATSFGFGIGTIFATTGIINDSPSLIHLGNYIGGPKGAFELTVVITIILALFSMFGSRLVNGLIYGSWIASIIGIVVMWYVFSTTSQSSFVNNWNEMIANNTSGVGSAGYANLYDAARNLGGPNYAGVGFGSMLFALPFASLLLLGGSYVSGFGAEIKNVKKSITISLFLSLIVSVTFWLVTSSVTLKAVGANWLTAVSWNWDKPGAFSTNYALPFPLTQPLLLAVAAFHNSALMYLFFITYVVGSIAPLLVYFSLPVKYLFAWSIDKRLPSKFSSLSKDYKSPCVSILILSVLAILGSVLYEVGGWSPTVMVGTTIWELAYALPGISIMIFPFTKRGLFAHAPPFLRMRVARIPVISIVGLLSAVTFSYFAYLELSAITIAGGFFSIVEFILFMISVAIGLVIYAGSHKHRIKLTTF